MMCDGIREIIVVEEVIPDMNAVLCEMLSRMFGHHYMSKSQNFGRVEVPPADAYMVFMQVHGEEHEGELIFTFNKSAADHLLDSVGDLGFADKNNLAAITTALNNPDIKRLFPNDLAFSK